MIINTGRLKEISEIEFGDMVYFNLSRWEGDMNNEIYARLREISRRLKKEYSAQEVILFVLMPQAKLQKTVMLTCLLLHLQKKGFLREWQLLSVLYVICEMDFPSPLLF